MTIKIPDISALPRAVDEFLKAKGEWMAAGRTAREPRVIAFHAPMGAGKTTFIAELCRRLGVDEDTPNSPTFAIINHYTAPAPHHDIYHFDLYRLDSPGQAFDIGAEDYIYSGALCLVEWPDNAAEILPAETLHLRIDVDADNGSRTISFE